MLPSILGMICLEILVICLNVAVSQSCPVLHAGGVQIGVGIASAGTQGCPHIMYYAEVSMVTAQPPILAIPQLVHAIGSASPPPPPPPPPSPPSPPPPSPACAVSVVCSLAMHYGMQVDSSMAVAGAGGGLLGHGECIEVLALPFESCQQVCRPCGVHGGMRYASSLQWRLPTVQSQHGGMHWGSGNCLCD